MNIQEKDFREKAIAYAESFLNGLTDTIDKYYSSDANEIVEKGYPWIYLTLYKKELGKDLSISVFIADSEFYVFFTKPTGTEIRNIVNKFGDPEYGSEWTHHTPDEIKKSKVKELLELNNSNIIGEEVSIPGGSFINNPISYISDQAKGHGNSRGQMYGEMAKQYIPQLREYVADTSAKLTIRSRYTNLKNNDSKSKTIRLTPQQVGHEFESLIRDALNKYGWQARKINIPGEGNDFTAIFEGHHILGETRWIKNTVTGEEVHAFAAKLTPRPQTIGLMISHSGFDEGAYAVAKRHLSNRTIVFFDKEHIEKIVVSLTDPGEIFSEELRNVYDFLFEKNKK